MDAVLGIAVTGPVARVALVGATPGGPDLIDQSTIDVAANPIEKLTDTVVGTHRLLADEHHRLVATGVCWSDQQLAAELRRLLIDAGLEDVALLSESEAVTALIRNTPRGAGEHRTAVLLVDDQTATLSMVGADEAPPTVLAAQPIEDSDATAACDTLMSRLGAEAGAAGDVYLIGTSPELNTVANQLRATSSMPVQVPDDFAIARGAAMAVEPTTMTQAVMLPDETTATPAAAEMTQMSPQQGEYMIKAASEPGKGPHDNEERPYLTEYLKLGYVPIEKDASAASRTLEYASDDFAIAQLAHSLGDTANYEKFLKQSENWKTLFDPETRWIRPKNSDGTWLQGFDADKSLPKRPNAPVSTDQNGFEEGNTYQYTFMIPFDYPELIKRIGGDDATTPRLDKFFSKLICWGEPCFNMANEPDFVTPYAYVFAGQPWKTQQVITRIEQQTFNTKSDGIPGNDDLGATSGVYVWNALGLYPGIPGVGGLLLGTPMFPSATVRFGDGRTLSIHATGTGPYVQQVMINGKANTTSWLPLSDLGQGASKLEFKLSPEPNKQRGQPTNERPPNFMQ